MLWAPLPGGGERRGASGQAVSLASSPWRPQGRTSRSLKNGPPRPYPPASRPGGNPAHRPRRGWPGSPPRDRRASARCRRERARHRGTLAGTRRRGRRPRATWYLPRSMAGPKAPSSRSGRARVPPWRARWRRPPGHRPAPPRVGATKHTGDRVDENHWDAVGTQDGEHHRSRGGHHGVGGGEARLDALGTAAGVARPDHRHCVGVDWLTKTRSERAASSAPAARRRFSTTDAWRSPTCRPRFMVA